MSEVNTTQLRCPCGTEIFRKPSSSGRGGKNPTYCTKCKADRLNQRTREHGRRQRAGIPLQSTFRCDRCNNTFPRPARVGPIPRHCTACLPLHEAERLAIWHADNHDRRIAISRKGVRKRRALLRGAVVEDFDSAEIFERDGWKCQLCGKRVNRRLKWPHRMSASLDHIMPLSLAGNHVRANVQLAHLTCNLSKQARPAGEQLLLIG